ncbi:hypothetical protein C8F04DRAFT_1398071 [Mycena alexandri]|uniref:Protein kinase domain-containing protein n=1 Tax=Mycena alexandri TaxID=1745969 RepID=A0AAD6WWG6_9AGAR|nr:hypothetical protein C8F04DRAFT_1398071 [Mycena alexandri]
MSSYFKAVFLPLEGGPTRLPVEYRPGSLVSSGVNEALRERSLQFQLPLAYFKLTDFPRDPISSLGQRLSDALPDILENRVEEDDLVSQVWPNGSDRTSPVKLDLLIIPEDVFIRHSTIASLPPDLRSRHAGVIARQTLPATMGTLPTPSTCSTDPKMLFQHVGTLAGRPFGRCGPATAIFDTHLAGLSDALRDLAQAVPVPSTSKISWALEVFQVSLDFYKTEADMEKLIRPLINSLFPGGEWQHRIAGGKPEAHGPGWIFELKNLNGLGGDPEAQAIADYEKLLADPTTMYGENRFRSRLPTILVSHAGSQLNVAVAVYAQVVLVDKLFSINLRDGVDVEDQVLTLARLATCLSKASEELLHYYNALVPASALVESALHLPYPASATPPHPLISEDFGLTFLYKLSRITGEPVNLKNEIDHNLNTRHGVFVALGGGIKGIPSTEVVVKFTRSYNTEAHAKLAALGLAPKLYCHTAVRGGLLMIVMEKLVGNTAFRWMQLNSTPLPSSVYTNVETAIKELHALNLVFGDLRLPNILVLVGGQGGNGNDRKEHSDGYTDAEGSRGEATKGSGNNARGKESADSDSGLNIRALLIDFDWTAKDGVGRYPAAISLSEEWSPDVCRYGVMRKTDDLYCLELLRQKCN